MFLFQTPSLFRFHFFLLPLTYVKIQGIIQLHSKSEGVALSIRARTKKGTLREEKKRLTLIMPSLFACLLRPIKGLLFCLEAIQGMVPAKDMPRRNFTSANSCSMCLERAESADQQPLHSQLVSMLWHLTVSSIRSVHLNQQMSKMGWQLKDEG